VASSFRLIVPSQWGARPPKEEIQLCGKASRIIFHHTAGHHPEVSRSGYESHEEAMAYARAIQAYHMDANGWIDSGHNFLVCRNGDVLVGRWVTVTAIQHGLMVISAHCPGQNNQIGIEHEHISGEKPTKSQLEASAQLQAWIAERYARSTPLPVRPHSAYYPTDCPDNLAAYIDPIRQRASEILQKGAP
jgi:hypothetical protein